MTAYKIFGQVTSALYMTNPSTIFIVLDLYAKKLAYWAQVGNLLFHRNFCLHHNHSFRGCLWIGHGDVINIQKYQNAVTMEIEVRISKALSESESRKVLILLCNNCGAGLRP